MGSTDPLTTDGVPLNVNNATGATSGHFTLVFNPALLSVTGFTANNTQHIAFSGSPTGGTFTLAFSNGLTAATTGAISYSTVTAVLQANIQNALDGLSNIGADNCLVNAAGDTSVAVTFTGSLAMSTYATMHAVGSLSGSGHCFRNQFYAAAGNDLYAGQRLGVGGRHRHRRFYEQHAAAKRGAAPGQFLGQRSNRGDLPACHAAAACQQCAALWDQWGHRGGQ